MKYTIVLLMVPVLLMVMGIVTCAPHQPPRIEFDIYSKFAQIFGVQPNYYGFNSVFLSPGSPLKEYQHLLRTK